MPKPARYDFDIYQNRTLRKRFRYRGPRLADGSKGPEIDLAGWHARLVIPNIVTLVDDLDPEGHVKLGPGGLIEWYVPDEVTAELSFGKSAYYFDLQPLGTTDWDPFLRGEARLWKAA